MSLNRPFFVLPILLALSGTAFAADQKVKFTSFVPLGAENPTADGSATLHYKTNQNSTSFQIMLDDFTPNTVYDVVLYSPTSGEAASCDVISVDQHGRGHFKTTISGDWTDSEIVVYLSDDCSFTEEEVRAVGVREE